MKKDSVYIDPNELKQIQKGLQKLFPKDRQTNAVLQKAMMKSSKPTINTLKTAIKNQASDSGRLAKSIRAFPGKNLDRYKRPTVFVGPLVKVPKRIKNKKGQTKAQRRAASLAWVQKKSGFYLYFLEYGFGPRGSKKKKSGLGLLPKAAAASSNASLSLLQGNIVKEINRKSQRNLGYKMI